jgi:hypothetical protein
VATAEDVRSLALALPETSERLSYGTPAFFAGKILFARLHEDMETLALKVSFDERDMLMQTQPDVFFVTPHYLNWPMVLVHIAGIDAVQLEERLEVAWRIAATKRMETAFDASRS